MTRLSLFLPLVVAAAAACSATVVTGGPPGGSPDGSSGPGDPSGPRGTSVDPDADDGPLWAGELPSSPKLVARRVTSSAYTTDDAVVYATAKGVEAVALPDGAPSPISTGAGSKIYRAGRAVLVVDASGGVTSWSKASGATRLEGMNIVLGAYDGLATHATASGKRVVVVQTTNETNPDYTKLKRWVLDVDAMEVTEVAPSVGAGKLVGCGDRGETITCLALRADEKTDVWTIGGAEARTRITLPSLAYGEPQVAGDFMFVQTRGGTYRLALANEDPPTTIGGDAFVALEGGWLATMTVAGEVGVMKLDGTGKKTLATKATLAPWIAGSSWGVDTKRIRWVPVCSVGADGKRTDLRVIDPATEKTVAISSSCELRGITYSDNYAFAIDDWVATPSDSIMSGSGEPIIVDLRDGSKRPNPTSESYFGHTATPIGKSRLLIHWLAFGANRSAAFYDGHTNPSTPAAQLQSPVTSSQGFGVLESGKGVLLYPRGDLDRENDLYFLAW